MKVIYLHGFNSDENSTTIKNLRKTFPDLIGISYDYISADTAHQEIKRTIETTLKIDTDIIIVGTSLGAFWAHYFAQKYGLKCVLLNPSLYPWLSLSKYIGMNKNFNSGVERILTVDDVAAYKKYETEIIPGIFRVVVLGIKDDVINYGDTEKVFQNNSNVILIDEGHRIVSADKLAKIITEASNLYPE